MSASAPPENTSRCAADHSTFVILSETVHIVEYSTAHTVVWTVPDRMTNAVYTTV